LFYSPKWDITVKLTQWRLDTKSQIYNVLYINSSNRPSGALRLSEYVLASL